MAKPHYKQPIIAENIETALQFYCEAKGYKYKLGPQKALQDLTLRILDHPKEIKSMHDIESFLDNDLCMVCDVLKSEKAYVTQTSILDYTLAANLPSYGDSFKSRVGQIPKNVLEKIQRVKGVVNSKK